MFNNRGAGYITKLRGPLRAGEPVRTLRFGGMAYELLHECIYDIDGALAWASQHAYHDVYLAGHSTGANKIVFRLSEASSDIPIKGAFLLSGGDDISLQTSRLPDIASTHLKLHQTILAGQANDLVPQDLFPGEHPISYQSFAELITEHGDYDIFPFARYGKEVSGAAQSYFKRYKKVSVPLHVIYGENDFGTVIPVAKAVAILTEFNKLATGHIIAGADHNFANREAELAAVIAQALIHDRA